MHWVASLLLVLFGIGRSAPIAKVRISCPAFTIRRTVLTLTILMPQIRPATVADIPSLLPLVKNYWAFENISGFDADRVSIQLTRLLSESHLGRGWIALEDNGRAAVGYLLAVYVFSLEYLGLTAEIDELFVLSSLRGQGVGLQLLKQAETEFIRAGCTKVALQLSRDNESARTFYRKLGYAERSGYELLDKTPTG